MYHKDDGKGRKVHTPLQNAASGGGFQDTGRERAKTQEKFVFCTVHCDKGWHLGRHEAGGAGSEVHEIKASWEHGKMTGKKIYSLIYEFTVKSRTEVCAYFFIIKCDFHRKGRQASRSLQPDWVWGTPVLSEAFRTPHGRRVQDR